eukprot:193374-Rhodomonas_salina.4
MGYGARWRGGGEGTAGPGRAGSMLIYNVPKCLSVCLKFLRDVLSRYGMFGTDKVPCYGKSQYQHSARLGACYEMSGTDIAYGATEAPGRDPDAPDEASIRQGTAAHSVLSPYAPDAPRDRYSPAISPDHRSSAR